MKSYINKRLKEIKEGIYGDSILEAPIIIDRREYKGRGRPKNSDYMSLKEGQRLINEYRLMMIKPLYKI